MSNFDQLDGVGDSDLAYFIGCLVVALLALGVMKAASYDYKERIREKNERIDALQDTVERRTERADSLRQRLDVLKGRIDRIVMWTARAALSETKRPEEMRLVAWVVRNRAESDAFPGDVRGVVTEPHAFTAFLRDRPPFPRRWGPGDAPRGWEWAVEVARRVISAPPGADPTGGATHFYSPRSMRPAYSAPRWAYRYERVPIDRVPTHRFRFYRMTNA